MEVIVESPHADSLHTAAPSTRGPGAVLYRFNTGGPMGGGVVTYAAAGKQYIAVASGSPSNFWTERNPGSPTIVVFSLPR